MWVAVSLVYKNRPLLIFPSHKIIVMIVNPIFCKEVWLGAGNPAGTIDQNCAGHPFPAPPPPHLTGWYVGRTINTESGQRFFSTKCWCCMDLSWNSYSRLIISIIFNISPYQHPLRKSKLTLCCAVSLTVFSTSLGCLMLFSYLASQYISYITTPAPFFHLSIGCCEGL
jgi:hypothetical protein